MPLAITRQISPRFPECELTHLERTPIDLTRAREQHFAYTQVLRSLGCHIVELPPEPDLPDSVFVEDAAFILPEAAVITRPGALSRRQETESIANVLLPHRPLIHLREPATLDGGDVLVLDKHIFVGLSTRSNAEAVAQLQMHLGKYGYRVSGVEVHACLHLKSAVSRLDRSTLLINPAWVDPANFTDFHSLEIAPEEPFAANILVIGQDCIYPGNFPKTEKKLRRRGVNPKTLDVSELAKAEGAVTCCSLIVF